MHICPRLPSPETLCCLKLRREGSGPQEHPEVYSKIHWASCSADFNGQKKGPSKSSGLCHIEGRGEGRVLHSRKLGEIVWWGGYAYSVPLLVTIVKATACPFLFPSPSAADSDILQWASPTYWLPALGFLILSVTEVPVYSDEQPPDVSSALLGLICYSGFLSEHHFTKKWNQYYSTWEAHRLSTGKIRDI